MATSNFSIYLVVSTALFTPRAELKTQDSGTRIRVTLLEFFSYWTIDAIYSSR